MLAMRWSSRLMGLASMLVVARLLSPADFGIFAVATALIGLLDALTDIGADISIIRHPDPRRCHYDTAWTFSIVLHGVCALLIALGAPLAADLYDDPRYAGVLQVLALSMLVAGFANIGIANFRRYLQFDKDFKYNVLVQAAGVLTTLALAFLDGSYWALVFGGLARSVAGVALSFSMEKYRPRLSLAARHEMFGFSYWTMVRSVALFLVGGGDRLVLGAFFAPAVTGWYAIASTLANMAVFELLHPIGRALLPGLAAMQGDPDWERRNLPKILGGTATIAVAAGVGLSALATPAMIVLYGGQFVEAGPMLSVLALSAAMSGFNQPVGQYLMVLGRVRQLAVMFSLEGLAVVGATYLLASEGAGIQSIVYARLAIAVLALLRLFYLLRAVRIIGWRDIAGAWLRPSLAGLAMYAALWSLQQGVSLSPGAILALGVPLGALVYVATLLGLWHLMKRQPGIEAEVLRRLRATEARR
jgi:O-antigen/teichoic acid export membrane protein